MATINPQYAPIHSQYPPPGNPPYMSSNVPYTSSNPQYTSINSPYASANPQYTSIHPQYAIDVWDGSEKRLRWTRRIPIFVVVLVLYSIAVICATMTAGGDPDAGERSSLEPKYRVGSERLKILSFVTHYPNTYPANVTDAQTSYYFSWYFTSACGRQAANVSYYMPCATQPPWEPFTFKAMLSNIDASNAALAGLPYRRNFNTTTSIAISAAIGKVNLTAPFVLFAAGIIISIVALVFFLRSVRRRLVRAAILLTVALAAHVVAAAWVTALAYQVRGRLMRLGGGMVDSGSVVIGTPYMALIWTAVVSMAFATIGSGIQLQFWRSLSDEQRGAEMERRRIAREERIRNAASD